MSDAAGFEAALDAIVARYAFRHARIGVAIETLAGDVLFERDANYFFQGASTTKIPTVASAIAALGSDFRFRTVVRHTGHIDATGVLHGDLIIVASGDPNLSARVQPDDTLSFTNLDHSLSGMPGAATVAGDPLAILRRLADSVVACGVRAIDGCIDVDIALFPEGYREPGTMVIVSPIVVNDNVIDIVVNGGAAPGARATFEATPPTRYVKVICDATTVDHGQPITIAISDESIAADGTRSVRINGTIPAGMQQLFAHPVSSPRAFARTLFAEVLAERGVQCTAAPLGPPDPQAYAPAILADHRSPPFSEAAKIVLKVSQNLHAELCPQVVGAMVDGASGERAAAFGFAHLARFVESITGDVDGIVQGDACGLYGYYTPSFMCRLLRGIAEHSIAPVFRAALPILGRDGTLFDIVAHSAAAGNVFAKTGTHSFEDRLRSRTVVLAKGLAGYIETAAGSSLVFAVYVNLAALEAGETVHRAGEMLGEIAAAAYDVF